MEVTRSREASNVATIERRPRPDAVDPVGRPTRKQNIKS